MNLSTKFVYLCFSKNSKCISLVKLGKIQYNTSNLNFYNLWRLNKNIFNLKYYQQLFQRNLKSRNGLLLGMAFFSPSLVFKKKELVKPLEHELPSINAQELNKKIVKKTTPLRTLFFYLYEAICIALRSARLILTFCPIFFLYPITYLGVYPHDLWWKLLLIGIEFSGPIFIKFGQWASTRRDLFPEVCCNQFARLQRRTMPHSWHYTKSQLTKAFGKDWRKIFVKFDNNCNPIGSGCIAQVYKVWMNEEDIKNKDILQEINNEQDDLDEYSIGLLDDGLEVWGFHKWWMAGKLDQEEEPKAISDFKRSRNVEKKDRRVNTAFQDLRAVTEELVDEIFLLSIKPNEEKEKTYGSPDGEFSEWDESESERHNYCEMEDDQTFEEDHLEHVLAEQWQSTTENLEKFLPISDKHPEDLEGLVPVALKVLHPRVYRTFRRDMAIFRCCARFVTTVYPPLKWLSLEKCVDEFFEVMESQIDLRKEANNLDTFGETFSSVETVRFPRPIRPYATRRVLVETFEEGEPISHFITDEKPDPIKKNLAKIGVDVLLKMIFTDNFIYGDLHPGNILVQNESVASGNCRTHDGNASKYMMVDIGGDTFVMAVAPDPNPLRLCILDCGVVAKLRPKDSANFRAVFKEVMNGNGANVANLFLEKSEHQCTDPESFRREMSELVQKAREKALTLEQVDVGLLLQKVLSLLLRHRIRLESSFSTVVLAVFVLEGLGRSLDPQMDILERARPLLL